MKDEANGIPIIEFVGLKPKMYSYKKVDGTEARRAKGIQRAVVNKQMDHAKYVKELNDSDENNYVNRRIQSFLHQLQTVAASKSGLSAYDDKRYIHDDGIHTTAYGHYKITEQVVDEDDADRELAEADEDDFGEEEVAPAPVPETPAERRTRLYNEMFLAMGDEELARMYSELD
jgi:hypothetical protein